MIFIDFFFGLESAVQTNPKPIFGIEHNLIIFLFVIIGRSSFSSMNTA